MEVSYEDELGRLFVKYKKLKRPIQVSFRRVVQNFDSDRATHLVHTYPAKLLPHIPYFFLNNRLLSKPGNTVLDPFCGSGTVLLEAVLSGRNAIGADANPLARLIADVKTHKYNIIELNNEKVKLFSSLKKKNTTKVPDVVNIDYWFSPRVQNDLTILLSAIKRIKKKRIRQFFLVCFSNCIKKVSLADPRVSVPVKLRKDQYSTKHPFFKQTNDHLNALKTVDVRKKFITIVEANIKRHKQSTSIRKTNKSKVSSIYNDARNLSKSSRLKNNSIHLVISSPPYAGAQKYIRASSLSLGWLEFVNSQGLKSLENLNIGREHYPRDSYRELVKTNIANADRVLEKIWKINPLRAHIAANYLIEMRQAFLETSRVLKPNGYFVLVAANNVICKEKFKTQEYLNQILQDLKLEKKLELIDDIKSYGLMTKRNKTASIITREWITIFQKK